MKCLPKLMNSKAGKPPSSVGIVPPKAEPPEMSLKKNSFMFKQPIVKTYTIDSNMSMRHKQYTPISKFDSPNTLPSTAGIVPPTLVFPVEK